MRKSHKHSRTIVLYIFLFMHIVISGQNMEQQFQNPPKSAKPQTWMHALDGNMSKKGLTKDLEAIADVGIGGVMLFNISQGIPSGNITYNSPEHRALLKHTAKECERLGLNFGIHNCDGWSASGGPWITPEQSMKMVVFSDTVVQGGKKMFIHLNKPTARKNYYQDLAVLAYPSMPSEVDDAQNRPIITSSQKNVNISLINDGKQDEFTTLSGSESNPSTLLFEYKNQISLRSLVILTRTRSPKIKISISNDGEQFTEIPNPNSRRPGKEEFALTKIYNNISAKYVKLEATGRVNLFEVTLSSTQFIGDPLGRISMAKTTPNSIDPIGDPSNEMIIDKTKIINLSEKMDDTGFLKAKLPKGNWTIMRFGYTTTDAHNHPATDSGRGLEVDKYHKASVKSHYDAFVGKVVHESMPLAPHAMKYVEIDSYEMGGQNWTFHYDSIFKATFNYNLVPFLPLYAGRFVESTTASEAVSYDIRKLNSQLMVENYFGYFTELCHNDGIQTYIEPYGNGPMDNLATGGKADIPMGEFWTTQPVTITRDAVNAANLYGKNIISAEAFTSNPQFNWKGHPATNKKAGDRVWTTGINEFMFHRFAHQPNTHVSPGMTMGQWGTHFDRTNTWWDNAGKAWFKYMARGQYLLRQGHTVCDLLIFAGDGSPNPSFNPRLPAQISTNAVNSDVLINRIRVQNGKLILPEGIEYQALILGNIDKIELPTLQRLGELAEQGAVLIGKKPLKIAAYQTNEIQKEKFNTLVDRIWAKPSTYAHYNWDELLPKLNIGPDLTVKGKSAFNFIHRKMDDKDIYFIYNPDDSSQIFECSFNINGKIPELWNPMTGEITKLAHFTSFFGKTQVPIRLDVLESTFVVFRESAQNITTVETVSAKTPIVEYSLTENNNVLLEVKENGTYKAKLSNDEVWITTVNDIPEALPMDGEWSVKFRKENGYDAALTFPKLSDWKDNTIEEVKYYSGTAIYSKTFNIDNNRLQMNNKLYLDLGQVNIAAKVFVNGKEIQTLWVSPFKTDITKALKTGVNELVVEVTNLWTNRLIGDERFVDTSGFNPKDERMPEWYINNQPQPKGKRQTFTVRNFYEKDKELLSSGLIGPVQIITHKIITK